MWHAELRYTFDYFRHDQTTTTSITVKCKSKAFVSEIKALR